MALTLADMTQHMSALEKMVVSLIYDDMEGGYQNILSVCPVESIDKLTTTFRTREDEGPVAGVGSRALYGAFPEGTGSWKQRGFQAGNIGGRAAVDQALLRDDPTLMKDEIKYKVQLINRQLNAAFINGDRATNPNFVNGVKKFVTTNMTIAPSVLGGSYTNGIDVDASTANQIAYIDLIEYVTDAVNARGGGTVRLIGNYEAQRQYSKAIRDTNRFGTSDAYYDKKSDSYRGVKWLNPGGLTAVKDPIAARGNTVAVIPNNLTYGTATNATQVWCVRFGTDNGVAMYQRMPLKVTELGRLQASPQEVTEIEWWGGFFAKQDDAVAVLNGVIAI
jgi:hypothetical protein